MPSNPSARMSVPLVPGALSVIGHIPQLLRDPLAFLTSLPAHGDLVRIRLGPVEAIVVCDPELTRQVLIDDRTFDKGGPLFTRLQEVIGDGLATCPHSRHRRQRRLTQPSFHRSRLSTYAEAMSADASAATNTWRDGQIVDVPQMTMNLSMRILMHTVFSGTLPPTEFQQTLDNINTIMAGAYRRMILPPLWSRLPTPGNRRYHQANIRLQQTVGDVIRDRRASGADRGDLLSTLLATQDIVDQGTSDDDRGLTDTELSDQLVTFFMAGAESSATTMAWALHLLAHHPDIEDRLHAEVDSVLAGAPAGWEHLPELELTSRIVTETLRLYPPGWIVTRTVTTGTRLGGHLLPAGTNVVYSPYVIHHRGDLYPDPTRFDPDRWDSRHRPPVPRNAFTVFGGGARKCIGDQFSIIETILVLATIAARWRLRELPGQRIRPVASVSLRPRGGMRMRVHSRTP
jgi:cytochrome P450